MTRDNRNEKVTMPQPSSGISLTSIQSGMITNGAGDREADGNEAASNAASMAYTIPAVLPSVILPFTPEPTEILREAGHEQIVIESTSVAGVDNLDPAESDEPWAIEDEGGDPDEAHVVNVVLPEPIHRKSPLSPNEIGLELARELGPLKGMLAEVFTECHICRDAGGRLRTPVPSAQFTKLDSQGSAFAEAIALLELVESRHQITGGLYTVRVEEIFRKRGQPVLPSSERSGEAQVAVAEVRALVTHLGADAFASAPGGEVPYYRHLAKELLSSVPATGRLGLRVSDTKAMLCAVLSQCPAGNSISENVRYLDDSFLNQGIQISQSLLHGAATAVRHGSLSRFLSVLQSAALPEGEKPSGERNVLGGSKPKAAVCAAIRELVAEASPSRAFDLTDRASAPFLARGGMYDQMIRAAEGSRKLPATFPHQTIALVGSDVESGRGYIILDMAPSPHTTERSQMMLEFHDAKKAYALAQLLGQGGDASHIQAVIRALPGGDILVHGLELPTHCTVTSHSVGELSNRPVTTNRVTNWFTRLFGRRT